MKEEKGKGEKERGRVYIYKISEREKTDDDVTFYIDKIIST